LQSSHSSAHTRNGVKQAFYAGLRKPRELTHDSKVYRAYQRAEQRLRREGGRVRRVVLDYKLKRVYQRFLHERIAARRTATPAGPRARRNGTVGA
jgi:hypothetical protein